MTLKHVRQWPVEVKSGSVTVKIYRVQNKRRRSFMVSYFSAGKRLQKMFADFAEAHAEARRVCEAVSHGDLNSLNLPNQDRVAFCHAMKALEPTGVPLDLAAKEYAAAWALLGGAGSLVEAAREDARRNLHRLPNKLIAACGDRAAGLARGPADGAVHRGDGEEREDGQPAAGADYG